MKENLSWNSERGGTCRKEEGDGKINVVEVKNGRGGKNKTVPLN